MGMGNSVLDTIEGLAYVLSLWNMLQSTDQEEVEKAAEELLSIGGGIVSIAKDPKGALAMLKAEVQRIIDEKGEAYVAGYISGELLQMLGLSSIAKGASKLDDVADIAKGASKLDDVADAGKGAKALNGEWKKVNKSMSEFSRAYQKQITGKEGMAWVQNGVKFDGMENGILIDAKGKYGQFVDKRTGEFRSWFSGQKSLVDQAERQLNAAEGAKIQWYFAEKESRDAVEKLFKREGITGIELIYRAAE